MIDRALYVAMTGASASLKAQATVSQNLANADTVGFQALLSGTVASPVDGDGHASRVAASHRTLGVDAARGEVMQTGNPLDVALAPDRWLSVQAPDGTTAYTRAGDLQINANGMLKTKSGMPVLDGGGAPVTLPPSDSVSIASDGTISVVPQGQPPSTLAEAGRLGVVAAPTREMVRGDDGLMRAAPGTEPVPVNEAALTVGALEGSNVQTTTMLVSMIEHARAYEMQVRVLQSADENARTSNSLLAVR